MRRATLTGIFIVFVPGLVCAQWEGMKNLWMPIALMLAVAVAFAQTTRIVYFRASPLTIHSGDPVTISWETTGTASVVVEWRPLVGGRDMAECRTGLPPKGSFQDHPRVSTIYVLECASELGTVCASSSAAVLVK